ncbi:MAG: alpha/beta hydrolase, partial [Planctomycetota bacterium]
CPDLRGHGRSQGERGLLFTEKILCQDLNALTASLATRHPGLPVLLAGESMGELLAAEYARREGERLRALALLVPAFQVQLACLAPSMDLVAQVAQSRIEIDTDQNLRLSSRSAGFISAKKEDPLVTHHVNPIYLVRLGVMGVQWPWVARAIHLPLFVGVAGHDQIVSNPKAHQVYQAVSTPPSQKCYKEWQVVHHTLFWDPETPAVVSDLTDWLVEQI